MNIARGRVPKDRVDFVVGDAYALPKSAGKFDAAFAGFWFSHVPKPRRVEFLRGLNSMLKSGAKVVLLDNRFIEGSSSPISEQDVDGNTYQSRKLIDGRTYRVLKNFPSETDLVQDQCSRPGTSIGRSHMLQKARQRSSTVLRACASRNGSSLEHGGPLSARRASKRILRIYPDQRLSN
jgi:hypothetical protein